MGGARSKKLETEMWVYKNVIEKTWMEETLWKT
jgi:hypothetical protein